MRREYVTFTEELPVNISLNTIKEYPLHWHKCIEIIFVLKGTVYVQIESETYEVREREIEIINEDEPHRIFSDDEDNKILIFKMDVEFFEKYYNDVKNIYFYTNSTKEWAQEEEKYQVLRRFLSILACEAIQKSDDYDEEIEKHMVKLLFHLVNNFHYLLYDEEDLKENDIQFERYHRISKFIYNNYMNKISLQDIAEREFLSSYYLSHEIKNMAGINFKEFLNSTRVHESVKLLLDTEKTISEISEDVGFSHTRYYNKYFKMYYNVTPLQYRKKNNIPEKKYEKFKKYEELNIEEAIDYISPYLEDYDRFNYEKEIIKINVDVANLGEDLNDYWKEIINLGDGIELLKEREQSFVKDIQKNIGFKYGIVQYLFHKDMRIYFNKNLDFLNWNEVEKLMEFMVDIKLIPMIILDKTFDEIELFLRLLESFILYFLDLYGIEEIQNWRFRTAKDLPQDYIEAAQEIFDKYELEDIIEEAFEEDTTVNSIFDTSYMLPYIIHNFINEKKDMLFLKAYDTVEENSVMSNELFFGSPGITTLNGIRKASYYAYYFLSRLGNVLIKKEDGYIVTRHEDNYQILIYSFSEDLNEIIENENSAKHKRKKTVTEREISLSLKNLQYDYKVTMYEIGQETGSAFNNWTLMGKPKRLTDEEMEVLYNISQPRIFLDFAKKKPVYNLISKIEGYGAVLITLQKVQKHLF
ncbi:helix-turn-helix domain-containing protein [Clostridium sp. CX1]|uniref:helix-turn-helix domain-containing protein n=1 Tax=Clostridium sp. CX1 TaxID=2978346 RepID=UPI0021C0F864|nr:helix-turn-helix domain-containing protein [Clostridium sp. CX1]MCT8975645.1 helix-turn-helix domain-containing protein [Clostridium sp. CX1]